jgi:hypothetical protein
VSECAAALFLHPTYAKSRGPGSACRLPAQHDGPHAATVEIFGRGNIWQIVIPEFADPVTAEVRWFA